MPETVSQHDSVNKQYDVMAADDATNVADRYDAQGKRCTFCETGLRCSLCSQGPCRITPKAPRGVCGIDAAGMVMRNLMPVSYTHLTLPTN